MNIKKKIHQKVKLTGFEELKKKVWFLIISLLVFRIGSFIPIPGINTHVLQNFLDQKTNGTLLEMLNMFSGGSLSRSSIFALGVMPYISASIMMQFLTFFVPYFKKIKKDVIYGQNKLEQYTKYITLFFSFIQSTGILMGLPLIPGMQNILLKNNFLFHIISVLSLVVGTIFLMWLGELITSNGLGNGISLIIFVGIMAGLPSSILKTLEKFQQHEINIFLLFVMISLIFLIIFLVTFVERSQRKILVFYAKRQNNRNLTTSQNSYLPLKVNMAGVMPAIFASSVILLPSIFLTYLSNFLQIKNDVVYYASFLKPHSFLYLSLYVFLTVFFCFFYTGFTFNVSDVSNNLKKSGAFLPGIRPGPNTAQYISSIVFNLTCIGAMYIIFICLLPDFMRYFFHVPFYFGGTSLLIVVSVIIEFISQLQTLLISTQYKAVLKKSNLYFKH
ncbi:preprotein translocase subunit SecY [Buchnera aphidicola]|uniref:Protein translocase subunit SecY n=1 Tax=Buchnera aphidicola subsp. Tuberolachnus salignus TaxID=98804 RepID=A0A160SZ29_BUCTT|nr:preprotein translocase subunit SecY [Buchnera aphidicola]CUR53301.1 Protein translocase subunit SecY [Buchnera aphidicola (Tuberolachnus salignus)]